MYSSRLLGWVMSLQPGLWGIGKSSSSYGPSHHNRESSFATATHHSRKFLFPFLSRWKLVYWWSLRKYFLQHSIGLTAGSSSRLLLLHKACSRKASTTKFHTSWKHSIHLYKLDYASKKDAGRRRSSCNSPWKGAIVLLWLWKPISLSHS